MRIVILDNALRDSLHHFFHFDCLIANEARKRWIPIEVHGCSDANEEIRRELDCQPTFHRHFLALPPEGDEDDTADEAARAYAADVEAVFHPGARESRTAWFVPVANHRTALGWARLLKKHPLGPDDTLTLLWNPVPLENQPRPDRLRALNARALGELREAGGPNRIHLVCDTQTAQADLAGSVDLPVHLIPITRRVPDEQELDLGLPVSLPAPLHFASLGDARPDKGFGLLVDALCSLRDRIDPQQVRFTLQGHHAPGFAHEILPSLRRLTEQNVPNVRVILHPLKRAAYETLLRQTHVLLLPYRLRDYRDRSSTLLAEAVVWAKPCVATAGTWLAQEASRHGLVRTFADANPEELAQAILDTVRRYPELAANARTAWRDARHRHDAGAFFECFFPSSAVLAL